MSYRSSFEVVECDARMKARDVGKAKRLLAKNDCSPESCFLNEMLEEADTAVDSDRPDALVEIPKERCWFSGNHISSRSLALVAPEIIGKLSGYFVGEGGEVGDGLIIENGRLFQCDVKITMTRKDGQG